MIKSWVKELTEDVMGESKMAIGKTVKHPDGYKIKIVSGHLWTEHGFSNFWYWKKVKKDGTLTKKIYHGYGW